MHPCLISMWMTVLVTASSTPDDLGKIDRTIRKLPSFTTATPHYGLLVFGPNARTRIWFVIDGNRLHVDRNGNGDLTEAGETITQEYSSFQAGSIVEADGTTRHTDLWIYAPLPYATIRINIEGKYQQRAFRDKHGRLTLSLQPATAPIVHFNGPVTLDQFYVQQPLTSKYEKRLSIVVGTPGVGPGTFATYMCSCFLTEGAAPEAEIDFPTQTPGGPPLRMQVKLDED
jgi:hypothetical protein